MEGEPRLTSSFGVPGKQKMRERAAKEHERRRSARIVTYNIHAGIGMDGCYSLERIAQTIAECDPAVVALQEVDCCWSARSRYDDQIAKLSASLQMHGFFAPIYTLPAKEPAQPERRFGLAILSRFPFMRTCNHLMTRLSTQVKEPRPEPAPGFAEVVVEVAGALLRILNVQLDYRPDPAVRIMQVQDVAAVAAADPHTPTVLVGDFNALPEAAEMRPLAAVWRDAWDVGTQGAGYTWPADAPKKRIDRIMLSPGLTAAGAEILQSQASDHLPLVAEVLLPEPAC